MGQEWLSYDEASWLADSVAWDQAHRETGWSTQSWFDDDRMNQQFHQLKTEIHNDLFRELLGCETLTEVLDRVFEERCKELET